MGVYPVTKLANEEAAKDSLERMENYLLKKHKNLEREEFNVDFKSRKSYSQAGGNF